MAITSRWGAKAELTVVRLLIDLGANVSSMDDDGWTPLYAAAERGAVEIAEHLIHSGAEVDQQTSFGYTPLHRTVRRPHVTMTRLLLSRGADISLLNNDRQTAAQIIEQESRGPSYGGDWHRESVRSEMSTLVEQYQSSVTLTRLTAS